MHQRFVFNRVPFGTQVGDDFGDLNHGGQP